MIKVNKNTCCGCSACAQKCPKGCISMSPDPFDGFLYPSVNTRSCVDCGLCERVCPVEIQRRPSNAVEALAVQNENGDVLSKSSSGGAFSLLAEKIIADGGVVFGARFDKEWQVIVDYTESLEGLASYRGSKYVQASAGTSYTDARRFLEAGRPVLFSGTPCQIAGLKSYLGREYDNLLTIDVICHGVPSPMVWAEYLKEQGTIDQISFRDKSTGWKNYSVFVGNTYESYQKNNYMNAFLSNIDLRFSCSSCGFKGGKSGSDITIGDFWGIDKIKPEIDNDKGLCCIIINTEKGEQACRGLHVSGVFPIEQIKQYNTSYVTPSKHNINRSFFFDKIRKTSFSSAFQKTVSASMMGRIERKIFRIIHK